MLPLAALYLTFLASKGSLAFGRLGSAPSMLMMMAGPLTVVPLALYAYAMPRVSMTESAILQYVTPTITFVLALTFFHEKLDAMTLVGYGSIWSGLALATYIIRKKAPRHRPGRVVRRDFLMRSAFAALHFAAFFANDRACSMNARSFGATCFLSGK